ncbi:MAG: ROK family transcriptional regulator [Bacteroidales bacterium]|nr:ROK family transcriptional regulator [Bacteroidales bacterium]
MKNFFLNSSESKNFLLKKKILGLCVTEGRYSIADLSRELNTSIPTTTKLVEELIEEGFLEDLGKLDTNGGRRPNIYGLKASAGYFIGTDVRRHHVSIAIADFRGDIVDYIDSIPFKVESSADSFRNLCSIIKDNIRKSGIKEEEVLAYGLNLSGRVNNETGYCFTYFIGEDRPIASLMEEELGGRVFVENDSRAMTYGEYICGVGKNEKDMLFINVTWGLGMGMILNGKLLYGKSGFSGEIGHFPMLNNDQICQCGKRGCLETGASGYAAHRILMERLAEGRASILADKFHSGQEIMLEDILMAIEEEDVLAIEVIEEIGGVLGRAIAGIINVFNPELVVIGGKMAGAREYLMLPIKAAIQKHSLNIINKDTKIKTSRLGEKGGPIGACMLSRSKVLGLL